jgi:hypothetical protein
VIDHMDGHVTILVQQIVHGEGFSILRLVVCRAAMVVYEADPLHKTQCVIT